MNVVELTLPTINKFSSAYLSEEEKILRFFSYNPFSESTFQKRKAALTYRSFRRKELADHLLSFNRQYKADSKTLQNIEQLKNDKSLVVIGGQQAGLLTGPIYTISKIISIIKLAEEQERLLGVPVLPVFWIAGEDHDFQEINHINIPKNNKVEKKSFQLKSTGKKMISDLEFNAEAVGKWVKEVVNSYGETAFTKEILTTLDEALQTSNSFVDFFANLITRLFKGTGLILVNASNPCLRSLETPFFHGILNQHDKIANGVVKTQEELKELGFSPLLDISKDSMNLFYHHHGERELLYWDKINQRAMTKDSQKVFSYDELRKLIEEQPEKFSNNVVTRPLMEEFLFPTLAFIGGPGEISYWAELSDAFKKVGLEMPPVVPRLNLTLLERHIDSTIQELDEKVEGVLKNGLEEKRKAWLYEQELGSLEAKLSSYYEQYEEIHVQLRSVGDDLLPHLQSTFEKNWSLIEKQFSYMKRLMERSSYEKYEHIMKKYHRVELSLIPENQPQERVWNIFYFLNKYGLELVSNMCELPLKHNGKHKVISL